MDSVSAYERLFLPHGDGYVFHPTKKSGGKFVTAEEHARLIADIRRFQRRGPILIAAWIGVAIVGWMVADAALNLPEWADGVFQAAAIAAACVFAIRGFLGPHRLVKGREAIVPPRPRAEVARETRAMLRWPHLILFGIACAVVLSVELAATERTLMDWAGIAVSGGLLCLFIWAVVRKLGMVRDRPAPASRGVGGPAGIVTGIIVSRGFSWLCGLVGSASAPQFMYLVNWRRHSSY